MIKAVIFDLDDTLVSENDYMSFSLKIIRTYLIVSWTGITLLMYRKISCGL